MTKQELEAERQRRLRAAQRLVIKLGTSVVTGAGGEVCAERIGRVEKGKPSVCAGLFGSGGIRRWAAGPAPVQTKGCLGATGLRRGGPKPVDARLRTVVSYA
jgi:hypothetical protein